MKINKITNEESFPCRDQKFPIEAFGTCIKKCDFFQTHWHNDFEIIKIIEGELIYKINGYDNIAKQGDILIVNPKQLHQGIIEHGDYVKMEYIIFNFSLINTQLNDYMNEKYLFPIINSKVLFHNLIQDDNVVVLFDTLKDTVYNKPPFYEIKTKTAILDLILYLLENNLYYQNNEYTHRNSLVSHDITRGALEFIDQNYNSKFSLDDLSHELNVSKYYLCRVFKSSTGQTINTYINNYRLSKAAEMLKETKNNITTVGYDSGFSSTSYFTSMFKKTYGESPSTYRKNNT